MLTKEAIAVINNLKNLGPFIDAATVAAFYSKREVKLYTALTEDYIASAYIDTGRDIIVDGSNVVITSPLLKRLGHDSYTYEAAKEPKPMFQNACECIEGLLIHAAQCGRMRTYIRPLDSGSFHSGIGIEISLCPQGFKITLGQPFNLTDTVYYNI